MGGVLYKQYFLNSAEGLLLKKKFFWERKSFQRPKKNPLKKNLLHKLFSKAKGKAFPFSKKNQSVQTKNIKKSLFFIVLLLNIALKPIRFKYLNFQAKNKSKRWTPSEGKSILHQHLFLLLSSLFFLFCLISYLIQFIFIFVLIIY